MNKMRTTFSLNPWKEGPHRGCFYKALRKLLRDHGVHIPEELRSREIKTYSKWRMIRAKHQEDISIYSLIFDEKNLPKVIELFDTLFDKESPTSADGEASWEGPRLKVDLIDFSGGKSITITVKPYSFCSTLRGHIPTRSTLTAQH